MLFTLEVYKTDRRTKAGTVLVSKTDYDLPTKEEMVEYATRLMKTTYSGDNRYSYRIVETYVTRRNIMSGKDYEERYDTPRCCSPSSETYWSM